MSLLRLATALLFTVATTASAATFTVSDPGDSGPGTLRQAILDANATPGRDTINVVMDVLVTSSLPAITDAVDIDGTTTGTGRATISASNVSFLLLEFAAGSHTSTARDLQLQMASLVRINTGVSGVTVANTRFINGSVTVNGSGNTIGGASAGDANTRTGIVQLNLNGNSNQVLRSQFGNVFLFGDSNQVGLIGSGNSLGTVQIIDAEGNRLEGNVIDGVAVGILLRQISGIPTTIRANTIEDSTVGVQLRARNTIVTENIIRNNGTGVQVFDDPIVAPVFPSTGVAITANSFTGNGIAIDLGGDGATPNDPAPDADTGANNLQNFPVLTSASLTPGTLMVNGTLTSAPLTSYQVELFSSDASDPEARTFLEAFLVNTDPAGSAAFTRTITTNLPSGSDVITSTATNRSPGSTPGNSANETSEISAPVTITEPGVLGFDPTTYLVNEAAGTVTITVTRTGGSDGTVTVDFTTSDGSATAPADYTATNGSLTFGDGVTQQTFDVPIAADAQSEPEELFTLTLSDATGGATIGAATATVTIAAANLTAVPTVSEWGLMAMAVALAMIALVRR